ncbi:MAG: hypothetical protein SCK57_08610 [Bacillota bacterium]|nr:hypothetical protein [Bacillota bacterium]MDW7677709.1 hypothetical protein [Bacillota bacterium]
MMNGKTDLQKKPFAFYLIDFLIGCVLFFHLISSWIVSRISYTQYKAELNGIFLFIIVTSGLCANYLMVKDDQEKGKSILMGLAAFIFGAITVSLFFIVQVGL